MPMGAARHCLGRFPVANVLVRSRMWVSNYSLCWLRGHDSQVSLKVNGKTHAVEADRRLSAPVCTPRQSRAA